METFVTVYGNITVRKLFAGPELEVLEYEYDEGYFYLVAPRSDSGVKTYEVRTGTLRLVAEGKELFPGDLVALESGGEDLHVHVNKGTRLLVHAYRVHALRGTLERMTATDAVLEAIQAKDNFTGEHSLRVQHLVRLMALRMGYSGKLLRHLLDAARFHDVGKVFVPDDILNKPDRLTPEEYEVMKRHVIDGDSLIRGKIEDGEHVWEIIVQHHEHLDGSGYPQGLKGDAISQSSGILAVADAFDAMTAERVYWPVKSVEDAVEELKRHAGLRYDRAAVSTLIEVLKDKGILE
jgi:HD-GYP domain-containing protein (c-di-GMP phosphodiesterase class II)